MAETVADMHNRLAGELVQQIVRPTLAAGGTSEDVLVLLESVIAGVLLVVAKPGGDWPIMTTIAAGVRERMTALRLQRPLPGRE